MSVIAGVGARVATGLDALGVVTAVRARKAFVRETPFVDHAGEAVGLATVTSIGDSVVGRDRFVALGAPALAEAAAGVTQPAPLFLAGPVETDPLDARGTRLLAALAAQSRVPLDLAKSRVFPHGRAAGAMAIADAVGIIARGESEAILVGGIDSYFDPDRLEELDRGLRLHGPDTENGFVPGEGAAFLLITSRRRATSRLANVLGVGLEREPRPYGSKDPSHALGATLACKRALEPARGQKVPWALTDVVGERHRVEEWMFASGRVQQQFTQDLRTDTPLLLIGDLGAASFPLLVVLACMGWKIGTGAGPLALVVGASDTPERGAVLLAAEPA